MITEQKREILALIADFYSSMLRFPVVISELAELTDLTLREEYEKSEKLISLLREIGKLKSTLKRISSISNRNIKALSGTLEEADEFILDSYKSLILHSDKIIGVIELTIEIDDTGRNLVVDKEKLDNVSKKLASRADELIFQLL